MKDKNNVIKENNPYSFKENLKGTFKFIRKYWLFSLLLFLATLITLVISYSASSFINYGKTSDHALYVTGIVFIYVAIIGLIGGGFCAFKLHRKFKKDEELNCYKDIIYYFFVLLLLTTALIVGLAFGIVQIVIPNTWYLRTGVFGIIGIVVYYLAILIILK